MQVAASGKVVLGGITRQHVRASYVIEAFDYDYAVA